VSAWDHASATTRTEATDANARRAANRGTSHYVPQPMPRSAHILLVKARRLAISATVFAGLILVVLAFGSIAQTIDYNALVHVLKHFHAAAIGWSILATSISFAALIGRDVSAIRYVGAKVPWLAPAVAGFCGTALSNAAGFGTLTGAAVRYRIYGAAGIRSDDIARLLLFIAAGFALGLTGFGGLATLIEAGPVAHLLGFPVALISISSGAAVAGVAVVLLFGLRRPIQVGGFRLPAPPMGLAAVQLALSGIRLVSAAAALWALLPGEPVNFFSFAAIFSAATALGAVSNLPGGIGVFEAVVFWAFGRSGAADQIAAALLAYRGIYYAIPLILSAGLLAVFEVRFAIGSPQRASTDDRLAYAAARLAPRFMGVITFATGIMLLVSGATPTFGHRLAILSMRLPLWVVEMSHFLGSLLGIVFLFVARGLFERRDGAWWIAITIATASLGLSLTKGLAYGEAGFLAIVIALLITTRRQFDRPASMLDQAFTLGWFATVGLIVVAATAIFLVAFRTADYTAHDLWWEFEFDAQAPRALRALLGAAVLAAAIGFWQLLRPPKGLALRPDANQLGRAAEIINGQDQSQAMLALMGDKSLLFSESGNAFIMYGKRGRSWIALFDPVGPTEDWQELIARFVSLAARHGGRAAFYQVRPETLRHYLDAGLSVMKLGEEACVQVATFELKGRATAHLRYALKRGERDGLTFELLAPHQMGPVVDALADISADWLRSRRTEEKGFSIAAFEPGYLGSQMIALVRQHDIPVAFATIMTTESRKEASVGLMRHASGASSYAMEFLFTRLIDRLKEMRYQSLSLGVAPLSGVLPAPLSSRWHKLGAVIWRYGTPFYNFRGLRTFKDKFNPAWEPRYLAASGTLGPFVTLADAAALIGLNFKGPGRYPRGA